MFKNRAGAKVALWGVVLATCLSLASAACLTPDPVLGCAACDTSTLLVLDTSSDQFTCTATTGCTAVDSTTNCIECLQGKTLNLDTATNVSDCNSVSVGCLRLENGACVECFGNNYYLSGGACVQTVIAYCWTVNISSCSECSDPNVVGPADCSVPVSACASFDYQTWQCLACPSTYSLDSSGVFCYAPIADCLLYQLGSCLQCRHGYFLSNGSCLEGLTLNLHFELLSPTYALSAFASSLRVDYCLDNSQYFSSSACVASPATAAHCLTETAGVCTECLPAFYLNGSSVCRACSEYSHCLGCDQYNCRQCEPEYYLAVDLGLNPASSFFSLAAVSAAVSSKCLPCSLLGCLYCRTEFSDSGINPVRCEECLFGYVLFNQSCYICPSGTYFSLPTLSCSPCIANCQYCGSNPAACLQCSLNYWFNATSGLC
jgi:hypothetical protein